MQWIKEFIKRRRVYNAIRAANSLIPLQYKYKNDFFDGFLKKEYTDNFSCFLQFAYKKDPEFFMNNISSFICTEPVNEHHYIFKKHPFKKLGADITILNIHYLYTRKVNQAADALLQELVSQFNYIDIFTFLILCDDPIYYDKRQSYKAVNTLSQYLKQSMKNKKYVSRPISTQLSYLILDEINHPRIDIDHINLASIINDFEDYNEEQKNIIINETYFTLLHVFLEYIMNEHLSSSNKSLHYSHKRNNYLLKLYKINIMTEIFFLLFPGVDVFKTDATFNTSLFKVYNSIFYYLSKYCHLKISPGFDFIDIHNNKITFLGKIDFHVLTAGYFDNQEEFNNFLCPEKETHLELISKIEKIQIKANKNLQIAEPSKKRVQRL